MKSDARAVLERLLDERHRNALRLAVRVAVGDQVGGEILRHLRAAIVKFDDELDRVAASLSPPVDLGMLDTCLSSVEQALNQLAVGQTAGGLASLRASSGSCTALDGAG